MAKKGKEEVAAVKDINVEPDVKATEAKMKNLGQFHVAEDRGDHMYKEFYHETKMSGKDLIVYTSFKKEFLQKLSDPKNKGKNVDINSIQTSKDWIFILGKEHEMPKFFHNERGPAYGAAYKDPVTGELDIKHAEYWVNAKRITDEKEIERLKFDQAFNKKADNFINAKAND